MPNEFDESGFEMPPKPVFVDDYFKPEHYDIDEFKPAKNPVVQVVSAILLVLLVIVWTILLLNP